MPRSRRLDCHNAKFVTHFVDQETNGRSEKRPLPLSVEQHDDLRKRLKTTHFTSRNLAKNSKKGVVVVRIKWERYCKEQHALELKKKAEGECEELHWSDWKVALKNLTRETTQSFFWRVCEWPDSRITSWGTTGVYIRRFQQLYTSVTGRFVDRNDSKEVNNFHHRVLVTRFRLRAPNINGKPVVAAGDLHILLLFNIAYDPGVFRSEGQRIQLAGLYQLLSYTGARPAELVDCESKAVEEAVDSTREENVVLLDELLSHETVGRGRPKALCYEDIQMMVVQHPVFDRATLAMAIKFVHHKGADNKPKPTVFYFTPAKKIVFCAVSTIISLALRDQAFEASSLTCAAAVLGLKVRGPVQSMALRWKKSMLKIPVFRKYNGTELSPDQAMPYHKLRDDLRRQSLDAGFEVPWTPRFFRRGAANAANGNAPDSVRDQMMRHDPKFATFHGAYLNEKVNFDLQNTFLEENTENQLYKLFTHVSLTRDPRATRDMVPQQVWDNLPSDPEIQKLVLQRDKLKAGRFRIQGTEHEAEIRQLTEKIRQKEDQRDKNVVKEYREFYFYHNPTWEIERQALGVEDDEYVKPVINLKIPERARLAAILCHQSVNCNNEKLTEVWIEAIDLMVTLFDKIEAYKRGHTRIRTDCQVPSQKEQQPRPRPEVIPRILDNRQCPDCIGDERLAMEQRTYRFCRPTVRNKHFNDQHLKERERTISLGGAIRCKIPHCRDNPLFQNMRTLDAFRNHIAVEHGISLSTAEQVKRKQVQEAKKKKMLKKGSREKCLDI